MNSAIIERCESKKNGSTWLQKQPSTSYESHITPSAKNCFICTNSEGQDAHLGIVTVFEVSNTELQNKTSHH